MKSLSSKNRGVEYLLCVKNAFIKWAWVKPLKDKKTKSVSHAFINIVNEFNCERIKLCVDQWREVYNSFIQKYLDDSYILMCSSHNEGKSVVAERFIKILKGKIYK